LETKTVELSDISINSTVFVTYSFIHTAWKHFHGKNDQLFILIIRRGTTLVGIAPFRIERITLGNVSLLKKVYIRVIRFIGEWGDKPALLTIEKPEIIWKVIFQYLNENYSQWDMISLAEQPESSPILDQRIVKSIKWSSKIYPEAISYNISINGTWEDYLKTRGKNTRRTFRINRDKLCNLPEEVELHCVEDPKKIADALQRFISIEQSGWKKNLDFTIGGNEKNKEFYKELLVQLANQNMASIFFLSSRTSDIAAEILYKKQNYAFLAKTTYREEFSKYSPGVILRAEIIKSLFEGQYRQCDLLGFQTEEKNTLKKNWSTGTLQTIRIQIYKKNLRTLLYANEDALKQVPRKCKAILIATMIDFSELLKCTLAYIT
jgi:hypothetical protein